jgi:2'-5' RNA ligase
MKKTLRTFIAVEISKPIRDRAGQVITELDGTAAEVKWVEPHNLHLTLKFLGDVHQRDIIDVCRAVSQAAAGVQPFELEVGGVGAFPNAARPRTVWLGANEGAEQMIVLHDRIEDALAELGFRKEHRRFQTHLTIGRVRGDGPGILALGERIQRQSDVRIGRMDVQAATVFSSTLTSAGPVYEVVGKARLTGA